MAYDEKYRAQAVAYKDNGHTFAELKKDFKICNYTYYKWVALKEQYGVYKPEKEKTSRSCKIVTEQLKQAVEEKPDAYLYELAEPFNCTPQAVFYALEKLEITYKKRRLPTRKNQKKSERNLQKNSQKFPKIR